MSNLYVNNNRQRSKEPDSISLRGVYGTCVHVNCVSVCVCACVSHAICHTCVGAASAMDVKCRAAYTRLTHAVCAMLHLCSTLYHACM